jgi:hypothetical protein
LAKPRHVDRVFLLQHQEPDSEDFKIVGVYASEAEAKAAIDRLKGKPGFCDFPEWFVIEAYDLNSDQWADGFVPPTRREISGWGCLALILLAGALAYAAISGNWLSLPFIIAYGLFFVGVGALAKRNADKTDFRAH